MQDLSGNVLEWTRSEYRAYPYDPNDGREELGGVNRRVLRGGDFSNPPRGVRCAFRVWRDPDYRFYGLGFRVVVARDSL